MPRTPRPLTIATKNATTRLIAENKDRFDTLIDEEMAKQGLVKVSVERWTKNT